MARDLMQIEEQLLDVVEFLDIDRMPTHKEMKETTGSYSLSNKINKTGGSKYWAERLGFKIKRSETGLSFVTEAEVERTLRNMGHKCELTSAKFPYDILVDGVVKIDVKAARVTKVRNSPVYSFNLEKKKQTCDVYVALCLDNEQIIKTYIIPAHLMTGKKQLCIGFHKSSYDRYIDRWDIIDSFCDMFKKIS